MKIYSPLITGSILVNNINVADITNISGFAETGSNTFEGSQIINGNLTVTGSITTQTLVAQTITSSVEFITGSTKNGSLINNTHEFTGSITVSGSLQVNGSNTILSNQTSSMSVATASYVQNATSASYWSGSIINAESASYALTASYALNGGSGGGGVGFPFSGSAVITGSLFVSGSTISGSFKGDGSQITGLTAGGKIHTQTSAASTWTVSHNLGVQYPNVTVYNSSNEVIIPQTITATDVNTLTLTFGSAVAGYAVSGVGGIINVTGRTTQQYFAAATTWSFAHNLGDRYVSIQAFDDAFEMMIPTTIRLVDATSSIMLFDSASSGYAVATIGGDLPAISSSYAGYILQVANSAPYSASWVAVPNVTVTTAQTASYANNFTVGGTLTAQTINVQTITSSIEFVTGSTRNGSIAANTHQFTGSVLVTGSGTFTSKLSINNPVSPYANGITVGGTGTGIMMYSTSTGSQTSIQIINASNYNYGTIGVVSGTGNIGGDVYGLGYTGNSNSTFTPVLSWTSTGYVGIGTISPTTALTVNAPNQVIDSVGQFLVNTTNSQGANIGGQMTLGGVVSGTQQTVFGAIAGRKESSTSGEYKGYLQFSTINGSVLERMRINSAGFTKISNTGTYANATSNYHEIVTNLGDQNPVWIQNNSTSTPYGPYISFPLLAPNNVTQYFLGCGDSATSFRFVVYSNGSLYNSTGVYAQLSDIKLKENIVDATPKLENLLKVKVRNYNLIGDELKQIGVIAQELEEIFPNMIDNTVDKDTGEITKGVKYSIFIPMLIKGLQEQQTQINELSAKNTQLEEILQRNNIQ